MWKLFCGLPTSIKFFTIYLISGLFCPGITSGFKHVVPGEGLFDGGDVPIAWYPAFLLLASKLKEMGLFKDFCEYLTQNRDLPMLKW
jgi:hypothetical protein